MSGLNQAKLVEQAVDEYVGRHREEFAERLDRALEALLGGETSALAYSAGVAEEDVARLGAVRLRSLRRLAKPEAGDLGPLQRTRGPVRAWL
jgi:hypothetical protein